MPLQHYGGQRVAMVLARETGRSELLPQRHPCHRRAPPHPQLIRTLEALEYSISWLLFPICKRDCGHPGDPAPQSLQL